MVRKGGIREQRAGFSVRHDRFLLYPTWFHEKAAELQERFRSRLAASHEARPPDGVVRVSLVASVAAVWVVDDLERLRPLRRRTVSTGRPWSRASTTATVRECKLVAVRVAMLPLPVELPEQRRYQGCVSWVALDRPLEVGSAEAVLPTDVFDDRLVSLHAALGATRAPGGNGEG